MALTMTVPMVAWMRYRGHGWRPCLEMAAAMFVPTFVAIALLGAIDFDALMMFEHVGMLRRDAGRDARAARRVHCMPATH